jgi:hypothetical protein
MSNVPDPQKRGKSRCPQSAIPCTGCPGIAGPFATTVNGMAMPLCAECAARLTTGEPKGDVIKTTIQKRAA